MAKNQRYRKLFTSFTKTLSPFISAVSVTVSDDVVSCIVPGQVVACSKALVRR